MKTPHFALALFVAWCLPSPAANPAADGRIAVPPAQDVLKGLKAGHPRLLASSTDFTRWKSAVKTDEPWKGWHASLRQEAGRIMDQAPSKYEIPDGLRLLSTSRRVLHRVYTLAWVYRMDNDARVAGRAWKELEAASLFPDWNPKHFLDTGEMTHAFAIGYDWLYDYLTPQRRGILVKAIVDKGLQVAVDCYRGTAKHGSWMKVRHNWNQVCNGGIGMGALAVADLHSPLAAEFLNGALESIQWPMAEYGPDGAWSEGPGYWHYATSYNVVFLAALESALGTDFGLSHIPGFAKTGWYPIHISGPLGRTFNYADGSEGAIRAPEMFWLARKFHQPAFAGYQRAGMSSPSAQDLVWYEPSLDVAATEQPLDKYFRKAEVAVFRGAWGKREAVYAGLKSGDNKANHSHLELGTFVLDALGERWTVDFGRDDYNLPGYFGAQRWNYYRLRAEGHNTMVINPGAQPDQNPRAAAVMKSFESMPGLAFATTDLTPAYFPRASRYWRGLALYQRSKVLLQDEVTTTSPSEAWWFMHTTAKIVIAPDGRIATLTKGNATLSALLQEPAGVRFIVLPAEPLPASPHPPRQGDNKGVSKLTLPLHGITNVTVKIWYVPMTGQDQALDTLPQSGPLEAWSSDSFHP